MSAAGPLDWDDARLVAALVAVDPAGLGGVVVRARPGPVRDRWLAALAASLPPGTPLRRLPSHVTEDRLLGGLDLAATLARGQVVAERGLLADAHGGLVVAAMAERLSPSTTAHLSAALDRGELALERDGLARRVDARLGVVALDEGLEDEHVPPALADRLAFHVGLDHLAPRAVEADEQRALDGIGGDAVAARVADARARLEAVTLDDALVDPLVAVADALGVASLRAGLHTLRAARAIAALAGHARVEDDDAERAVRLVLAPRATRVPAAAEAEAEPPPPPPSDEAPPPPEDQDGEDDTTPPSLEELLVAAAAASIPPDLLASLALDGPARGARETSGTSGAKRRAKARGRPAGTRRGRPEDGERLNVVETLRAAAPWQRLRRATREGADAARVHVRLDDFRVTRFVSRTETLAIFVVDASGSSALQRMAEAKGAVETVLADCYARRDGVALLAFRGTRADLLLPPTRSLVRAKRALAELPGGGATPLAAAIDAATTLALDARRRGQSPLVVFMTDGRGNVARDGALDRARGEADATLAARVLRAADVPALLVDTSPRPRPAASAIAAAMGARYVPLPSADARAIADLVAPRGEASRAGAAPARSEAR
jgi:magnesium chelatase subunit D